MPDPGPSSQAFDSGPGNPSNADPEKLVVDRLLNAQHVVEQRAAALESAQLFQESSISTWRFGFLCVG